MTDTKHTPTPWEQVGQHISDSDDSEIATTSDSNFSYDTDLANAAHIVKCVNMHDDLVEAITSVVMASEQWNYKKDIDAFNALSAAVDLCNEALKKAGAL